MLKLGRKIGQCVMVTDHIQVIVENVGRDIQTRQAFVVLKVLARGESPAYYTLNEGEGVHVCDHTEVIFIKLEGQALLGFEAPKNIAIDRLEVHLRKKEKSAYP